MSRYLIVIEKAGNNFSAFCPDLPGCIATGTTKKDVEQNIKEAIAFHIEGLKQDRQKPPKHPAEAKYVLV